MKSCAFTGHRPQNLPFGFREDDERCTALKETLKKQIISLITDENVTHFISGMALGVDMYAAEIVLELKKTYPAITLESAIPCETQAAKWNAAMRERYYGIAAQCDKETLLQTHYTPDCMDKRNRYMVDHADYIIAVTRYSLKLIIAIIADLARYVKLSVEEHLTLFIQNIGEIQWNGSPPLRLVKQNMSTTVFAN